MAKEIVAWCDVHLSGDEHITATSIAAAVGGPTLEIDLCERCAKTYVEPLRQLLEQYGQPLEAAKPPKAQTTAGRITCPQCEKSYASPGVLAKHLRDLHGMQMTDIRVALDGEESNPFGCPDCPRRFTAPQGLSTHRRKAHGYSPND